MNSLNGRLRWLTLIFILVLAPIIATCRAQAPAKPLRIMCIGASITMGLGVNGGYRLPLEKMLEGAGIPFQFVGRVETNSQGMDWPMHDGYPGHRIDQIENGGVNTFNVKSLPIADGVGQLQPDVILLFCGTNDIRQHDDLANAPGRLDHLIGTLRTAAPAARILVSSITPDLHDDDAVRQYDQGVAALVTARAQAGQPVQFVDNYAAINPGTDLQADRTHPNAVGYLKIARSWFNALFPNTPQIAFLVTTEGRSPFAAKSCMGYQITMKKSAVVTGLGLYCGGKPLDQTRSAGVFDTSGQLLAQVAIGPADLPSGLFAYGKLGAPLTLAAGNSYVVAANCNGLPALINTTAVVDPLHLEDPRFYFDHNVAVILGEGENSSLPFPGTSLKDGNGGVGYFGPIFCLAP